MALPAMPRAALFAALFAAVASASDAQARVLCTGVHVLCSLAGCELASDDTATCACVVVNDTYAVAVPSGFSFMSMNKHQPLPNDASGKPKQICRRLLK